MISSGYHKHLQFLQKSFIFQFDQWMISPRHCRVAPSFTRKSTGSISGLVYFKVASPCCLWEVSLANFTSGLLIRHLNRLFKALFSSKISIVKDVMQIKLQLNSTLPGNRSAFLFWVNCSRHAAPFKFMKSLKSLQYC